MKRTRDRDIALLKQVVNEGIYAFKYGSGKKRKTIEKVCSHMPASAR